MSDGQTVKITIGGHELTVSSDHPAEYTRAVASYFDDALREIRRAAPTVDAHRAAILAGLAVTDELFRARESDAEAASRLTTIRERLARIVPAATRGTDPRERAGSGN